MVRTRVQRPRTFVAVKIKEQFVVARLIVLTLHPAAAIPDDHRAGTVVALGDDVLEVEVFDGMVLRLHGRLSAGSSDGPLGTAQHFRTPSISRRRP